MSDVMTPLDQARMVSSNAVPVLLAHGAQQGPRGEVEPPLGRLARDIEKYSGTPPPIHLNDRLERITQYDDGAGGAVNGPAPCRRLGAPRPRRSVGA